MKKRLLWKLAGAACFLAVAFIGVETTAFGQEVVIGEEELAQLCETEGFTESRTVPLPEKGKEGWSADYELHYKEILLSEDGGSFTDNPHDMKGYRSLDTGKLILDYAEGYEISFEYHIKDEASEGGEETIIEGGKITPYYRAVKDPEEGWRYSPNDPEVPPIIPDLPRDYDWKQHGDTTLCVYPLVTLRSLKDQSTYSYESSITFVTNLYKEEPDCYFLMPTDQEVYVVKPGDSLWKIAREHCEEGEDWVYINSRNKDRIKNPDNLEPGTLLVIPNVRSVK